MSSAQFAHGVVKVKIFLFFSFHREMPNNLFPSFSDYDERERKSKSSADVASLSESQQSFSRRRRFFDSVRKKFASSGNKSKDKNENLKKSLSQSQPNIMHSTPDSNYVDLEYEPSVFRSSYRQDSFDAGTVTPPRTRSLSQHASRQMSDFDNESTPSHTRTKSDSLYQSFQQQASFSDGSITPPKSRSQSQHASLPITSSEEYDREEKEENDSAIDVIELSQDTQVRYSLT